MAINLAEKYSGKIDQAFAADSYTDKWVNNNYDFDGVKTVKVYTLTSQEPVDYDRTSTGDRYGGNNEMEDIISTYTLENDKGFKIVFKPHFNLLEYLDLFDIPDEIYLSRAESYQDLLDNSSVLITDFSPCFFDFAYLKKPVVYFHSENDCGESHFDYGTMAFGEVLQTTEDVLEKLNEYIENDCKMEEEYKKRVDNFFTYSDKDNCKRVYDWILEN